jgi:preprotein translocase subunit SecB
MADEGDDILQNIDFDAGGEGPAPGNGEDTLPAVGIISQYVKDLSVENPSAPDSFQWQDPPQVDVQFNIGSRSLSAEVHEVELKITIASKHEGGTAFVVELAYAGLVGMRNLSDEQAHPFLFAEAPRILFPFARRIVADAVRDAGYPPLMLEPIDFNGLYLQQLAQRQSEEQGATGEAPPIGNA